MSVFVEQLVEGQVIPTGSSAIIYILTLLLFFISFVLLFNYFSPTACELRWFARYGKLVDATVVKIDMRRGYAGYATAFYYSVQARWKDVRTGKHHLVSSAWVCRSSLKKRDNPNLSRDIAPGEPIKVLVDPRNPEHAMIVSLLPKTYEGSRYFPV
jgi:hypothetical protein